MANGKAPAWLAEVRRLNGSARAEVEALFLRALATLAALPDREVRVFHVTTVWPLCPRDGWFGYSPEPDDDEHEVRFVPTPADLDRVLDVLAWGAGLDCVQWAIARDRADGFLGPPSWR